MSNPRITNKDLALIKGALRRVFARSDVRRKLIDVLVIKHSDPSRKRVKTWCRCPVCEQPTPKSYMVVDHHLPVIELHKTLYDYTVQELADRIWCEEGNLSAMCKECHKIKTKAENKQRRLFKKERK